MKIQEFEEIKALIESLKADALSTNEVQELEKQKLKQETHKSRWILPIVQSITPLCALFITLVITFKTNLLDNKNVLNQVTEKNNNIANTEANLQLENKKRELLIETYSLSKIKDTLGYQNKLLGGINRNLDSSNKYLITTNDSFKLKVRNSQQLVNNLLNQKQKINLRLKESITSIDSIKEERLHFSQIANDLFSIKKFPQRDNPAVDSLIHALQSSNKYSQRIIDTIGVYINSNIPYLPALCAYIAYFGLHYDEARAAIIDHLQNRFDSSKKSSMNYGEILTSYRWSSTDRIQFTKILMGLLKPNIALNDNLLILRQIASFQRYFDDYHLDQIDFGLFIKYLHYCNIALNDDYEYSEMNKVIVESIAVMCPQIFISERFITIRSGKKMFAKKDIDTTRATLPKLALMNAALFDESTLAQRILDRYQSLYLSIGADHADKASFYKRNKGIFDFWDNVLLEKKPVDMKLLKKKIANDEM
jgi:hypothetical protein